MLQGVGLEGVIADGHDGVLRPVFVLDGVRYRSLGDAVGLFRVEVQECYGAVIPGDDLEHHVAVIVSDEVVLGIMAGGDKHDLCGQGHQLECCQGPSFHVNLISLYYYNLLGARAGFCPML